MSRWKRALDVLLGKSPVLAPAPYPQLTRARRTRDIAVPDTSQKLLERLKEVVKGTIPLANDHEVKLLAARIAQAWTISEHKLLANAKVNAPCFDGRNNGLVSERNMIRWMNILTERCFHGNPKAGIIVKDWWCRWETCDYADSLGDIATLPIFWFRNFRENSKRIADMKLSLRDLYARWRGGLGPHEGKPAYIIGSGPSLEKNVKELNNVTNGIRIVVNGAARLVDEFEYFVSVDWLGAPWWWEGTEEKTKKATAILYWGAAPETYARPWKFIRPFGEMGKSPYDAWVRQLFPWMDDLDRGYTGTFSAFHLAVMMGCGPIIFVGQDFAYGHARKAHAGGYDKIDPTQDYMVAPDLWGSETITSGMHVTHAEHLRGAARWCAHQGTKIINATEGGILSSDDGSIEVMPLEEVVKLANAAKDYDGAFVNPEGMIPRLEDALLEYPDSVTEDVLKNIRQRIATRRDEKLTEDIETALKASKESTKCLDRPNGAPASPSSPEPAAIQKC